MTADHLFRLVTGTMVQLEFRLKNVAKVTEHDVVRSELHGVRDLDKKITPAHFPKLQEIWEQIVGDIEPAKVSNSSWT